MSYSNIPRRPYREAREIIGNSNVSAPEFWAVYNEPGSFYGIPKQHWLQSNGSKILIYGDKKHLWNLSGGRTPAANNSRMNRILSKTRRGGNVF